MTDRHLHAALKIRLGSFSMAELRRAAADEGLSVAEWCASRAADEVGQQPLSGELSIRGEVHFWDYEPPLGSGHAGILSLRSPGHCVAPGPEELRRRLGVHGVTLLRQTVWGSLWHVTL